MAPQGYQIFLRRISRGILLFRVLWLAFMGLSALAFAIPEYRHWTIICFLLSVIFAVAMNHVSKRHISAWKVSDNPKLVYWAYPTTNDGSFSNFAQEKYKGVTLHLRDGCQLDVDLPPKELQAFLNWLKEENHSIRWGNYDQG